MKSTSHADFMRQLRDKVLADKRESDVAWKEMKQAEQDGQREKFTHLLWGMAPSVVRQLMTGVEWQALKKLQDQGYTASFVGDRAEWTYHGEPITCPPTPEANLIAVVSLLKMALDRDEAGQAALFAMQFAMCCVETGSAGQLKQVISIVNGLRGRKSRRPRLRTRAMLAAFADGRDSADAVEGFLNDGGVFTDEWGEISIAPDGDEYMLIDESAKLPVNGQRPFKVIIKADIAKLIAETHKKHG